MIKKYFILFIIIFLSKSLLGQSASDYSKIAEEYFLKRDYQNAIKYYTYAIDAEWYFEPKYYKLNGKEVKIPGSKNNFQSLYYSMRAKSYLAINNYNNAIKDLLKLDSYYSIAEIYEKLGNELKAKEYFTKAYNKNPCQGSAKKYKKYDLKVGFFTCMFTNNPNG